MPICIAGMHRSGTSMVARLLNLCGVYLGEEKELMGATSANPEGYWENYGFYDLNNELLERLGGGWDLPPAVEEGWEKQPQLEDLYAKATALIRRFDPYPLWGWKDPRNSLTLPFWTSLIPNLHVVICIRNPLEVSQSLTRRGWASTLFGLDLWQTYNRRVLAAAPPFTRVVTHYDVYFHDAAAELGRILAQLDISVSAQVIASACQATSATLHHNRATLQDLIRAHAPYELVALYLALCAEAGQIDVAGQAPQMSAPFEPGSAGQAKSSPLPTHTRAFPMAAPRKAYQAKATDEYELIPFSDYRQAATADNATVDAQQHSREFELRALLLDAHEQIWKRDELIGVMRKQLDEANKQIDQLKQELALTYEQIRRMQETRVWKLGQVYWRILAALRPKQ